MKLSDTQKIISLLDEFESIYKQKKEEGFSDLYAIVNQILMELKLQCATQFQNHTLTRAIYLMSGISNQNIKIEDVAQELSISYDKLYELFKKELGITPKQYLTQVRMEKAKSLLLNTKLSIKEIAYACGYLVPIVFTREFRKIFNINPREFRDNLNL